MSINISDVELAEKDFTRFLINTIKQYELLPTEIQIEITETATIQNIDQVCEILTYLKNEGLKIALDDFGTGYSSLNYLKDLPVDTIKLDKSYVSGFTMPTRDRKLVEAIISLGHAFNLEIVAEGIEQSEEFELLKLLCCDCGQGYLFHKPLKSETFEEAMEKETITNWYSCKK
jgi:EAL domain-containing protein (putative c-di-GMP-specific phosphodiesterase class I)